MDQVLWSATVRGGGERFERAQLVRDDAGRFVFVTSSASAGSEDRAVIDRDDLEALADVLVEQLDPEADVP